MEELQTISYRTGGIRREAAAKAGLVFVERAPAARGPGVKFVLISVIVGALRISYEAISNYGVRYLPGLSVLWTIVTAIVLIFSWAWLRREELWLSRGQIYCARRVGRGPLAPVMSAQTVKNVDIVLLRRRDFESVDAIEIAGAEGVVHFGQTMDMERMLAAVQKIRNWVERERGWALPQVIEESGLQQHLESAREFGRGSQTWEGVDLVRQNAMNRAWSDRWTKRYCSKPKVNSEVFVQAWPRAFELPAEVKRGISAVSLVLFVSFSVLWIVLTMERLCVGIVKGNWVSVIACMPFVAGGVVLGWILWVLMGEAWGKVKGQLQ
jgi:hypothetical protein